MYEHKYLIKIVGAIAILMLSVGKSFAENIDPNEDDSQYTYGENIGWINFEPNVVDPNTGAQVGSEKLTGFVWAQNIGWISLSCENTSSCGTVDFGVTNDGSGNLSGYAWAQNVGWINFDPNVAGDPNHYGVTIDENGNFHGYAWGENIGWINFGLSEYYVVACKVRFEDLANFTEDWLDSGGVPGNFDSTGNVDFADYSIFASYWFDYCPDSWPLK